MYYRRKVVLALLQEFGPLYSFRLHKYLFLLTQEQQTPVYSFVPYKYGCFSFQCAADMRAIENHPNHQSARQFTTNKGGRRWEKVDSVDYISMLSESDQAGIRRLKTNYGDMNRKQLISYIYKRFPYYASNSEIVDEYLSEKERFHSTVTETNSKKLYTIGYEGKSIDQYIDTLLRNQVSIVCDVRKNASSMKYGFSKNQLKHYLGKLDIEYIHLPDLGISSSKRQCLNTTEDYKRVFNEYVEQTLRSNPKMIKYIEDLLERYSRVALTCFENDHEFCHRSRTADALSSQTVTVKHLLTKTVAGDRHV